MTGIAQFAQFKVKYGRGKEIVAALEAALVAAEAEAGTEVYAIHVAPDDPDTIWMYELYVDTEAQVAHATSAATDQLRAVFEDLISEPVIAMLGIPHKQFGLPQPSA